MSATSESWYGKIMSYLDFSGWHTRITDYASSQSGTVRYGSAFSAGMAAGMAAPYAYEFGKTKVMEWTKE